MSAAFNLIAGPFDAVPTRQPGTVAVAVGARGSITLAEGSTLTWGERVFGGYRTFYLVDLRPKTIVQKIVAPSNLPAIGFVAELTYDIKVVDPRRTIERGITDLQALMATPVRSAVTDTTRKYRVDRVADALEAVRRAVFAARVDPAVQVVHVAVDLQPDEQAREMLRKTHEVDLRTNAIKAENAVTKLAVGPKLEVIRSPESMLAHYLATSDPKLREALEMTFNQAAGEEQRRVEIMKALIENKLIGPKEFQDRFPDFVRNLTRPLPGPAGTGTKILPGAADEGS